jgi:hypothetical protein
MIMNEDKMLKDIFDGSFNQEAKYFDISESDRNIIAEKFIQHHLHIFQQDRGKVNFYVEYFDYKRKRAIELENYEEADLYERFIKKLFLLTIDF